MPSRRALLFLALCSAAIAAPACASGNLVDVQVVDRVEGQALATYQRFGSAWVAGQPGHRYAVQLVNRTGARVLVVLSVDGINAITGETAGTGQSGYVLGPYASAEITGWRKSSAEAAAFYFTSIADSYAARTDRPDNVGVIGAAVFRERVWRRPEPRNWGPPTPFDSRDGAIDEGRAARERDDMASARERARGSGSAAGAAAEPRADGEAKLRSEAAPPAAPRDAARMAQAPAGEADRSAPLSKSESRLGTGHGEREYSPVTQVTFERATSQPAEIVKVRYDSWRNLVALGVVATPRAGWEPNAFPRWAPDPR
jgi:hypothetical protein